MRLLFPEASRGTPLRLTAMVFALSLSGCALFNPMVDTQPTTKLAVAPDANVASTETSKTAASTDAQVVTRSGVSKFLGYISPYRITIQQGNFVSQEMMSQLKVGMTREQVRFLLGTALLTDMFHEDRWDYPFRLQKPNGDLITSRVAVFFKNNTVQRFEGGNLPTEKDYLAHITTSAIGVRAESSILTTDKDKKK
ncbi:outer membrane protein assembly factor BamE [Undibacterium sp. Jales W-56]|uniref:outer membrane protein assembly factor BamE n=1 Tax=Undibacterium sp. Jales W-56 TaxID=2897325 RepID=UPI0021D10712|nr:outer membrane protein assembly factor BamE [Undibacterium sp. Jales W-56]MCU6434689.1 outer membrane protein assembly factor BamE [Undibacterium sp. Jales W-56]